jgi:Protein tyrosine and serine/threonine kinase
MSELRRITERYRLDKLVVSSDTGSLFRGTDAQSGETVAVKLINSEIGSESESERERFLDTARAFQAIHHPSLPKVLDFGFTTAGSAFLVTEYLHGTGFQEYAGSAPARVLSLLLLVIDGLEALAQKGITTRNLRAENLLVVPGAEGEQVKILGLGTAALRSGAGSYGPVEYREDLRAFGRLVCCMLGLPEGPASQVGVPLEIAVELEQPEVLISLLHAALEGDPEGRFDSYQEVRRALRLALFGQTGRKAARNETLIPPPLPPQPGMGIQMAAWAETRAVEPFPPARSTDESGITTKPGTGPGDVPLPPSTGTVILSSPFQAGAGTVRWGQGGSDETRVLSSPAEPSRSEPPVEPMPESRTGRGTVRVQLPADPSDIQTRVFTLPVPSMPGTVQIPTAALQPPSPVQETIIARPAGPIVRETGTVETPLSVDRKETSWRDQRSNPHAVPPPPPPPVAPTVVEARPEPVPPPLPPPVYPMTVPPLLPLDSSQVRPAPATPLASAAAPAAKAAHPPAKPGRGNRLLLMIGVPAAALAVVGISLVLWFGRSAPEPPPAAPPKPATKPAPPPRVVQQPVQPMPVHGQLQLAEGYVGLGDLKGAKAAVEAITPEEQAAFTVDEQTRYQRILEALAPLVRQELAANLARGLERADLRLLRSVVASVPAAEKAAMAPAMKQDLDRAQRALDADSRLTKAQRTKDYSGVIRHASALLQELPRATRASEQREQAADALETEAASAQDEGQFELALSRLETLRQVWPDRAGLDERFERIRAEKKADQDLEAVLAAATRAERANKPLDGLEALNRARPNQRFEDRFREVRQRLEAQFVQLDRQAPALTLRGPSELTYEKGKAATVPLRITDDFSIKAAEGWARAEGGQYVKIPVRQVSGSDYEMEILPGVHQNKIVEYYVTATDQSGHSGQLGSPERPLTIKRKGLLKRIFGGKDKEGEEDGG